MLAKPPPPSPACDPMPLGLMNLCYITKILQDALYSSYKRDTISAHMLAHIAVVIFSSVIYYSKWILTKKSTMYTVWRNKSRRMLVDYCDLTSSLACHSFHMHSATRWRPSIIRREWIGMVNKVLILHHHGLKWICAFPLYPLINAII